MVMGAKNEYVKKPYIGLYHYLCNTIPVIRHV